MTQTTSTSGPASTSAAVAQAPRRWLFGPVPDLLFGCGLAYVAIFVLMSIDSAEARRLFPLWVMNIAIIFVSMPHYGATLLRVYEQRNDRRTYALFGVWVTVLLGVGFYWGLHDAVVGSLLFTLYLTWSPWHYTGQNYGIALMFLYRNGVQLALPMKRLLYASFVLSFVITFFLVHGQRTVSSAPVVEVRYLSLGIPAQVADLVLLVAFSAYAYVTVRVVVSLARQGGIGAITPALVLMGTQALWFVFPALYRNWFPYGSVETLGFERAGYFFTWIALAHAAQYLWITAFYSRASGRSRTHIGFFLAALLAGVTVWTLPALVFSRSALGPLPYVAGLSSMIAAVVNLHHFILDGAIWKLRDSRIARRLLSRAEDATEEETAGASGRPLWQIGVAAAGVLCVFVAVIGIVEGHSAASAIGRADLERAETAVQRMTWIGQDNPWLRTEIATVAGRAGDLGTAEAHLRRSLAFFPTADAWGALGEVHARRREWDEAIRCYREALALEPLSTRVQRLLAEAHLAVGERDAAKSILERALEQSPGSIEIQRAVAELDGATNP